MASKVIIKDFTRELSVWQQEIEIEANHQVLPKVLGIGCSVFFFASTDSVAAAYRLAGERKKLPEKYLNLVKRKQFAKELYQENRKKADLIKGLVKRLAGRKQKFGADGLVLLRKHLLAIWPAYLFGYNILRYQEKGLFIPKNSIEIDNFKWARKLHYYLEGIYDAPEVLIDDRLAPILIQSGFKRQDWRRMTTENIIKAIESSSYGIIKRSEFVIDNSGIKYFRFDRYIEQRKYKIEKNRIKLLENIIGTVAYKGKVSGRVKKLSKNNPEELGKI